jgi:hypothetical protein
MARLLLLAVALVAPILANDPADSWLSYAAWTAPNNGRITALNTTFVVPSNPATYVAFLLEVEVVFLVVDFQSMKTNAY